MKDRDKVKELDNRVRGNLRMLFLGRKLSPREAPQSVEVLCESLRLALTYKRWFVATSTCALLGELIYASRTGGIYKVNEISGSPRDRDHAPLAALRNACFHPAFLIGSGKDTPPMERLVGYVRKTDPAIALELGGGWPRLQHRSIASWAIRQLDATGKHELGESR